MNIMILLIRHLELPQVTFQNIRFFFAPPAYTRKWLRVAMMNQLALLFLFF